MIMLTNWTNICFRCISIWSRHQNSRTIRAFLSAGTSCQMTPYSSPAEANSNGLLRAYQELWETQNYDISKIPKKNNAHEWIAGLGVDDVSLHQSKEAVSRHQVPQLPVGLRQRAALPDIADDDLLSRQSPGKGDAHQIVCTPEEGSIRGLAQQHAILVPFLGSCERRGPCLEQEQHWNLNYFKTRHGFKRRPLRRRFHHDAERSGSRNES